MVLFEGSHARTEPTLNPWELQRLMGLGINVGNVLETPFENTFALTPTEENFQMFHDAGFANVRIPVHWGKHMMVEEPFTIDAAFLARVAELVDAVMAKGLICVITAHHEWWIDVAERTSEYHFDWEHNALPRFCALWRQVAEHFRHHRQLLIFGILNEPHELKIASLNELHRSALIAIRHTNPSRIVTISGKDFANPRWLLDNQKSLWIPRDPQIMLEIHMTEPHIFAGTTPSKSVWGTPEDHQKLQEWVHQIEVYGRRNNLPIYVAEFGCSNEQGENRRHWIEANWKEMRSKGFAASLWDDGDRFSIYSRENGAWDQDILLAMQRSMPGMKGVGFRRAGGGLGGDSVDPTQDLQRRIEDCFKRLTLHLDEVDTLTPLEDHEYISHTLIPANEYSDSESSEDSDDQPRTNRQVRNARRASGVGVSSSQTPSSQSSNQQRSPPARQQPARQQPARIQPAPKQPARRR